MDAVASSQSECIPRMWRWTESSNISSVSQKISRTSTAWPNEDGGPQRTQAVHGTLGAPIRVTSRDSFGTNMVVHDGERVFVQRHTFGPEAIAWVEQIDPITLDVISRSRELAGGPYWAGGMAIHSNGDLYVVFGN